MTQNGNDGSTETWVDAENRKTPGFAGRVEEERLVFSAAEVLAEALEARGISKSQLAAKLGKSKAFVTQLLGGQNLTLRTMARVAHALGFRIQLKILPLEQEKVVILRRVVTSRGEAEETTTRFADPKVRTSGDYRELVSEFQPSAACG